MPNAKAANVSDVFAAVNPPPIPSTGGLVYKKAWEIEDEKSGLTDNQRTMREFCSMANSLIPFIQVTSDSQDDNEGKTLPVLDLQCWVEGGLVLHKESWVKTPNM